MTDVVYVQITTSLITIRNLSQQAEFQDIPQLAIQTTGKRPKVIAYGKAANAAAKQTPGVTVLNGFAHPRSLLSDFELAEKTLRLFLKEVDCRKFKLTPFIPGKLILHPLEKTEGGLTQIERRAWEDLGYRVMAKKVWVWVGRALFDHEILASVFPSDGVLHPNAK